MVRSKRKIITQWSDYGQKDSNASSFSVESEAFGGLIAYLKRT